MSTNFSINDLNDRSNAHQIMRGINKSYETQDVDDTSIIDLASQKAQEKENKSGITVALEDFSKTTKGFSDSRSCIKPDDTKKNIFEKIASFFGFNPDNIFKSKQGAEAVEKMEVVSQNDLFRQEALKNGGIQYAKEGDDIYESALNFAKADIGAIEKANSMTDIEANNNKDLEFFEINSYKDFEGNLSDAMDEIDLDGNSHKISPEEYASYLIATDGLVQIGENIEHAANSPDGKVSFDEASLAANMKNAEFKEAAQKIYDEHYN